MNKKLNKTGISKRPANYKFNAKSAVHPKVTKGQPKPSSIKAAKIAKAFKIQERHKEFLNRLELRAASKWRNFFYDPTYKPKRYKKKRIRRIKFIAKDEYKPRYESYSTFFRRYRLNDIYWKRRRVRETVKRSRLESRLVRLFIGVLLKRGKKLLAIRILRSTLNRISLSSFYLNNKYKSPLHVLFRAIKFASPRVILKSKRVGGVVYRLPVFIEGSRRLYSLGIRWLVSSARRRSEYGMDRKLSNEIFDLFKGKGSTYKRKIEVYKTGVGNKPFLRYLWGRKKKRGKLIKRISKQ